MNPESKQHMFNVITSVAFNKSASEREGSTFANLVVSQWSWSGRSAHEVTGDIIIMCGGWSSWSWHYANQRKQIATTSTPADQKCQGAMRRFNDADTSATSRISLYGKRSQL